jgi:imidazolonepropionase
VNAARALGLADRGQLVANRRADLVIWDIREPAELAYWIGGTLARRVFAGGRELHDSGRR